MSKKTPKKQAVAETKPRTLKTPTYRSFRLQKKLPKQTRARIPSGFRMFRQAAGVLKRNWKVFLGIIVVYALLNVLLVQGFFTVDLESAKASLGSVLSTHWGKVSGGLSLLSYMFGNAGTAASTSAYRLILMIIVSLASIWTLRQVLAGEKIRVRDSFYAGMHPLIPFTLVFLFICLQLIPVTLAIYLFSVAGANGGMEIILWTALLIPLVGLTLYMLSASIFALYIVCLPGMEPMAAIRAASDLVRYRRFFVIRRMLLLPFILAIGLSVVMIPLFFLAQPVAVAVFFIFLMVVLPLAHSYMYLLYRELLHEG